VPHLDVDERAVVGTFVRHIPGGGDPLYRPTDAADNRWQRARVIEAWYFAEDEETAWAEWYRALAGTGLPPGKAMPRDLWRWKMDLPRVALLDNGDRLARVGLPAPRPSTAQWPAFQAIGEALHAGGCDGLLAVSAARPARSILVVFRPGPSVQGCTPTPPPDRHEAPPPVPSGMRT
jgi:hypothetical protein